MQGGNPGFDRKSGNSSAGELPFDRKALKFKFQITLRRRKIGY